MKRLLLLCCFLITGTAFASDWTIDPANSTLTFIPDYQEEPVPGEFKIFTGSLSFDPEDPVTGTLHVVVNISSADMGSEDLHEGMRTPEWFDTANYPKAEFVSNAIRHIENQQFAAEGTLTLKGVSRKVTVPFVWQENHSTAQMSGELDLSRKDFDIGTGEWLTDEQIGFKVHVQLNVMWRRQHE
jgi:polyisoprenoid-binding protein YceI